jgi:hypothetical protein
MKTMLIRAAAGAAALAAGIAGAQTYSGYPGYGYSNSSGLVRCESINSRSNFCRADTRGGVQIVRQLSRERCVRGRNWEVRRDGIVVDDGCRAEFALGSAYGANGTYMGTDRYGRPIYGNGGYTSGTYDPYGRPIYDSRYPTYGSNGGYTYDRYGNRVYTGTSNGYYSTDRYGNRIYVTGTPTSNGYYTTDRYGNRIWVAESGTSDGYYTTDRYGNRIFVPSAVSPGGYYTTDRYGNRVYVPSSYEGDSDPTDEIYERNRALGPYGTTPYYGGTTSTPTTTGTSVIYCTSGSDTARTYCGDNNQSYTIRFDSNSKCLLDRTYGRDSGGTWVSGGCSLRLEPNGY